MKGGRTFSFVPALEYNCCLMPFIISNAPFLILPLVTWSCVFVSECKVADTSDETAQTVAYVHQTRAHMTHGVRVEMMAIFVESICVHLPLPDVYSSHCPVSVSLSLFLCKLQVPWSTLHKLYTHRQFTYQRNKKKQTQGRKKKIFKSHVQLLMSWPLADATESTRNKRPSKKEMEGDSQFEERNFPE